MKFEEFEKIRIVRNAENISLAQISDDTKISKSLLSMYENGKRTLRKSQVSQILRALEIKPKELDLHKEVQRQAFLKEKFLEIKRHPEFQAMKLRTCDLRSASCDDLQQDLIMLGDRLITLRKNQDATETPQLRKYNLPLVDSVTKALENLGKSITKDNFYYQEIEDRVKEIFKKAKIDPNSVVDMKTLEEIAKRIYGFTIKAVNNLPGVVGSAILYDHKIIVYNLRLPSQIARMTIAHSLAHLEFNHPKPNDIKPRLEQRSQATYFMSSLLMPESRALKVLEWAKEKNDLCPEYLTEMFNVNYDLATQRLVQLLCRHLGIRAHFLRIDAFGNPQKIISLDGVELPYTSFLDPAAPSACRRLGAYATLSQNDTYPIKHYQFSRQIVRDVAPNDSPEYFCVTTRMIWRNLPFPEESLFTVTFGCKKEDAIYFRGFHEANAKEVISLGVFCNNCVVDCEWNVNFEENVGLFPQKYQEVRFSNLITLNPIDDITSSRLKDIDKKRAYKVFDEIVG